MNKRNIKLLIQYDGTRYRGWQRLDKGTANDRSIQGRLEELLSRMTGEKILITGSGRTDAGVHALGQTANFTTLCQMDCHEIRNYCNNFLPEDIQITEVSDADERFHSRYNAVSKCYLYRIWNAPLPDIFRRKYLFHVPDPLDISAMKRCSRLFEGIHDFQSFTVLKPGKKDTVREIFSIEIEKIIEKNIDKNSSLIEMRITGSGFMHMMVRIMAGTLIECGRGAIKPEDIPADI
jgi:tRNA pseudouridine38-40 synthase